MVVRGSTVIAVVLMGACSASHSSPSSRDPIASLAFTSAFAPPVLPSSVQGGTLPLHPERLTPALVSVRGAAVQLLAARRGRASGGGGRGGGRAKRDEIEDEEITTFVSCPNCLADTCARPPLRLLLELYRACCRHQSFSVSRFVKRPESPSDSSGPGASATDKSGDAALQSLVQGAASHDSQTTVKCENCGQTFRVGPQACMRGALSVRILSATDSSECRYLSARVCAGLARYQRLPLQRTPKWHEGLHRGQLL